MVRISSSESGKDVGRDQDMALTRPVIVSPNGRDRQVLTLADFTDPDIEQLERTRAPKSAKAFDPELKL